VTRLFQSRRWFDTPLPPAYSAVKDPNLPGAPTAVGRYAAAADFDRHAVVFDVHRSAAHRTAVEHRLRSMAKGSFGELLKRERETREISLNELTVATRVPLKFLEAFENEGWEKLPGGVFNRGFVRAIARYLGLSEEHLLAEYDLAHGESKIVVPPPENPIPSPSKWLVALGVLVILLGVAGVVAGSVYGWRRYAAHRAAKRSVASSAQSQPQAPAALPNLAFNAASSPVSSASAASASPVLDLTVTTSAATRVRVVADGKILLDRALPAGETRHFSAARQFQVTAADPSGVLLELNGQAMPPLGAPGTSGTIVLSQKDLRQARGGNSQP
jgi:cytoskeleton protein RodZ